ncbi:MAG: hypothetical protein WCZ66_11300 [Sphingomonadaceae bacterium]
MQESEISTLIASCATLAAVLGSALPGDTVRLNQSCDDIVIINGISKSAPGITLDASTEVFRGGLRLNNVFGLNILGGTFEAGPQSRGYATHIVDGGRIIFDDGSYRKAYRGMVVSRTKGITVRNSRFVGLQSDGINIAGTGDNGLIENNRFGDFSPTPSRCTYPDGSVEVRISSRVCKENGGQWKDGDHPDAIQTWGYWGRLVVRNNIVENLDGTAAETQGINSFGEGPPQYFAVDNNRVQATYSAHISNFAKEGTVIGNMVKGKGVKGNVRVSEGIIACDNQIPDVPNHPAGRAC